VLDGQYVKVQCLKKFDLIEDTFQRGKAPQAMNCLGTHIEMMLLDSQMVLYIAQVVKSGSLVKRRLRVWFRPRHL
jgi:hypothetical protein